MIKKVIINVFITIILSLFLLTIILMIFNINVHVVSSNSMKPTINKYDLVYIKYLDNNQKSNLSEEDIVLIRASTPFIHRIIDKQIINNEVIYETKGDFNNSSDGLIESSRIIGKYVFKIPLIGIFFIHVELIFVIVFLVAGIYFIKTLKKKD